MPVSKTEPNQPLQPWRVFTDGLPPFRTYLRPRSAEPVGGAARFQTLLDQYKTCPAYEGLPNVQTIFSGDAFSPSIESSISKGRHMVPFLNRTGIDVACLGVSGHVLFKLVSNGGLITEFRIMISILASNNSSICKANASFLGFWVTFWIRILEKIPLWPDWKRPACWSLRPVSR